MNSIEMFAFDLIRNTQGLDEIDDYLLVPQSEDPLSTRLDNKTNCIVPAKLGTVFSQEKEKLDVHLQNEFIEDGPSFQQRPNDNHRFVRVGLFYI